MSHSLVCWKCGASLAALTLPLRRLEVCASCGAELHVCRMCVEYDTSKAKSCREPIAEEVRDKEHANFCDFFKPRPGAFQPRDAGEIARAHAGLDALFGTKAAQPPAQTATEEVRRLDDLFKPKKP